MSAIEAPGTNLGATSLVPNPRYTTVRATAIRRVVNEWILRRPLRMLPNVAITPTLLWLGGCERWRVAFVATVQLLTAIYNFREAAQARRRGADKRAIFVSHLAVLLAFSCNMAVTGGLTGPLWAGGLFGATVGTLHVFGRSREGEITVGLAILITILMVFLPKQLLGPPIAHPFDTLIMAWAVIFTLLLIRASSYALSNALRESDEALDRTREEVISGALARTKGLDCIGSKVAHELKNPLSAIKGLVQLVARSETSERSRERLEVVASEVERMETILREYLSFSRPLEDLARRPVDLADLTRDVAAVLEARADSAGVALQVTGGSACLSADPQRLKEAILNLLTNALEATPEGGSVTATVEGRGADVLLTIRDTGRGMAPEELARIGTPFFTTRKGGTGLGVVLARAVVRHHGGDVSFSSELGKGTVVTLRLPLAPPEGGLHG